MEDTPEIRELFDYLYLNQRHLSVRQSELVAGCRLYFTKNQCLSEMQFKMLLEIRKYLNISEPVRYTHKTM